MFQVLKRSDERYESSITECLCRIDEYYYEDFVNWSDGEHIQEIVDCFNDNDCSCIPWNSCIDNLTVYSYCLRISGISIID